MHRRPPRVTLTDTLFPYTTIFRSHWARAGAIIHNVGDGWTRLRAIHASRSEHRRAPFDRIQAIFSGSCSLVAVAAARLLRVRSLVHIAGGALVALPGIAYSGPRRREIGSAS